MARDYLSETSGRLTDSCVWRENIPITVETKRLFISWVYYFLWCGIMKKLHKGSKNNGSTVETKSGERGLLCSNKAIVRSPDLGFNSNAEYASEDVALDYLASILVEAYLNIQNAKRE